jgi:hypothetical protein
MRNTVIQCDDNIVEESHRIFCNDPFISCLDDLKQTLPKPLYVRFVKYYNGRLEQSCGRPMLGAYAISIFSDLLGISSHTSQAIEPIWLLIYYHAILIDDLLDHQDKNQQYDLILSQILLDRAYSKLSTVGILNSSLFNSFEKYRLESWESMVQEIEWSNGGQGPEGTVRALRQQGRKSSLAKFCATMLTHADGNHIPLTPIQEDGIEALCAGIQMLDDIADFFEDYQDGRTNVLFQTLYNWIKSYTNSSKNDLVLLNEEQILVGLVISSSFINAWRSSCERIEQALDLFRSPDDRFFTSYFKSLAVKCRASADTLSILLNTNNEQMFKIREMFINNSHFTTAELNDRHVFEVWHEMLLIVQSGPNASN